MRTGRPTKLTPALQARIVKLVREGNYPETAAQSEGVSRATYYEWMERGRRRESPFADFSDAVTRARATAQRKMLGIVVKAAPTDPENARWYLERTAPDRFGRRDKMVVENLVSQELDGFLARIEQRLDLETYERVLAALADDAAGDGAPEPPSSDEGRGGSPQDPLH
jgi:transposase-like protein